MCALDVKITAVELRCDLEGKFVADVEVMDGALENVLENIVVSSLNVTGWL